MIVLLLRCCYLEVQGKLSAQTTVMLVLLTLRLHEHFLVNSVDWSICSNVRVDLLLTSCIISKAVKTVVEIIVCVIERVSLLP